jgi:hypothetical protein
MIEKQEEHSDTALRECRLHFLRAAAAHPRIILGDSLRRQVFEPSKKRWRELGLPEDPDPRRGWTLEQYHALVPYYSAEAQFVRRWASHHHLNYEWVRQAADEIFGAASFPSSPFSTAQRYAFKDFSWADWHFEREDESTYRKRMRAMFRTALNQHISTVKLKRAQFLKDRGSQSSHYRWAAERVCLRWGWSQIAEENRVPVSWQAVRQAVLPILARIGILVPSAPFASRRTGAKKSCVVPDPTPRVVVPTRRTSATSSSTDQSPLAVGRK